MMQHKGALCGLKGPLSAAPLPPPHRSCKQGLILQGQREDERTSKDESPRLRRDRPGQSGWRRATGAGGPLRAAEHPWGTLVASASGAILPRSPPKKTPGHQQEAAPPPQLGSGLAWRLWSPTLTPSSSLSARAEDPQV